MNTNPKQVTRLRESQSESAIRESRQLIFIRVIRVHPWLIFSMTLTEMRALLAKRDIQLTKSLGQNFLHDGNQLRRIVDAAELTQADKVLEIGPGLGPLTELLVEKAGEVLAIEMDARLVEFLCERFGLVTKEGNPPSPALSPEERENVLDTSVNPASRIRPSAGTKNSLSRGRGPG